MLVLDENRLFGADAANLERLKAQIQRDRIIQRVRVVACNEEWNAKTPHRGVRRSNDAERCAFHGLDAPLYDGGQQWLLRRLWNLFRTGCQGFNYHFESMDAYHAAFPRRIFLAPNRPAPLGHAVSIPTMITGLCERIRRPQSRWGCSAEEWWSFFATRPWASGGLTGRALTTGASRRLTNGPASIRILASSTHAVFRRITSGITSPGGPPTSSCICCRIGIARQGRPGH